MWTAGRGIGRQQHLHQFQFARPLAKLQRLHLGIEFGTASFSSQHMRASQAVEYHEQLKPETISSAVGLTGGQPSSEYRYLPNSDLLS